MQNDDEGGHCTADEVFSAPHPIGNRSSHHPHAIGKKFRGPPIQTRREILTSELEEKWKGGD